jgi:hypothetical protein
VVKNKAELTITIDGEEIKRKRLSHVQPSEMVSVTLEPEDFHTLSDLKDNVLEVNIR